MINNATIAISAIIVWIIIMSVWVTMIGWTSFSHTIGDTVEWEAKDISKLKFKKCMFTINDRTGTSVTQDVSGVLNSMAIAYRKSPLATAGTLSLVAPLNTYSFAIKDVNTDDQQYESAVATLTGYYKEL